MRFRPADIGLPDPRGPSNARRKLSRRRAVPCVVRLLELAFLLPPAAGVAPRLTVLTAQSDRTEASPVPREAVATLPSISEARRDSKSTYLRRKEFVRVDVERERPCDIPIGRQRWCPPLSPLLVGVGSRSHIHFIVHRIVCFDSPRHSRESVESREERWSEVDSPVDPTERLRDCRGHGERTPTERPLEDAHKRPPVFLGERNLVRPPDEARQIVVEVFLRRGSSQRTR